MNKRQRKKHINKRFASMGGHRRLKAVTNVMMRFDSAMSLNPDAHSKSKWLELVRARIYWVLTAPIEVVKAAGYLNDSMPYVLDYETTDGFDRANRVAPKINILVRL